MSIYNYFDYVGGFVRKFMHNILFFRAFYLYFFTPSLLSYISLFSAFRILFLSFYIYVLRSFELIPRICTAIPCLRTEYLMKNMKYWIEDFSSFSIFRVEKEKD